tara:strand:- start:499 stop:705 length:207 start_codon:yes stop_codon:yes gene_type:complete
MTPNNYSLSKDMIFFLIDEIGLDPSSIELGLKLSIRNNTPLPVLLWSYGMLTIDELDKLYSFLFKNIE